MPKRAAKMLIDIGEVVREMGDALFRGDGAYFVGSGISAGSGLPDWVGLMDRLAEPLGIRITNQDNLPLVAQFCVNVDQGNRGPIIGRLKRMLSIPASRYNTYHAAISRTNLSTIWTTNFDVLLETVLSPSRLAVRANDSDLTSGTQDFDIELLKLHGCINRSTPKEFVLTQEDYEEFEARRPALGRRLRHDLTHRSILFIGYSYRDPNISTAVVEARRLSEGATREYFLITMQEKDQSARRRQELWLGDLRRSGIRSAVISEFDELTDALNRLALASRGKSVFVTGSHQHQPGVAEELGKELASEKGVVLLDGQSEGTGRSAANSFGATCVEQRQDIRERIRYFPNPYSFNPAFANDRKHLSTLKEWRASLFRAAHVVIVFDGGMGTEAEVEVAREMGCRIIPVPTSSDGSARGLIKDPAIRDHLSEKYLKSADSGSLDAKDVMECVRTIFKP
jgi:SIR2-like domain/Sir2- and TIR-associating SLOG family